MTVLAKVGDVLEPGSVYAECDETPVIRHRCMMMPGTSGTVVSAAESGSYTVEDTLVTVKTPKGELLELSLQQKWPIRTPRPVRSRRAVTKPLVTGQRIIDTLFPLGKGGCWASCLEASWIESLRKSWTPTIRAKARAKGASTWLCFPQRAI